MKDVEDDAALVGEYFKLSKEQKEILKYRFNEFNPEVAMDMLEFKLK
jgi:hypothetical protein